MKKSAGVYVKLNGNAKLEGPSTKGVGLTKSVKPIVPSKAGSNGVGPTKSQKAKVSPASKKK